MKLSIELFKNYLGAITYGNYNAHEEFDPFFLTDSRHHFSSENVVFFALKTPFADGHEYINELISKNVKFFVVEKIPKKIPANILFFKVNNTLEAMQIAAKSIRERFKKPVWGITGSNGKTIVKEWLVHLLKDNYNLCYNSKSFNSQLGVPLSVSKLNQNHDLGIFEAGISQVGEMIKLEKIINPNIGIFTHFGSAHSQGFKNEKQKKHEKLKLFKNCEIIYSIFDNEIKKKFESNNITFGYNIKKANFNITKVSQINNETRIVGVFNKKEIKFKIPFIDDASVENSCLCALICLHQNCFNAKKFQNLPSIDMRLQLLKGKNNCLIINDAYTNDLSALASSLAFLKKQSIYAKNTAIISDFEEFNPQKPNEFISLLKNNNINKLIVIGEKFYKIRKKLNQYLECVTYKKSKEFINDFNIEDFKNENILIKGARQFQFEKIVNLFENQIHQTVLEINMNSVLHNLDYFKKNAFPNVKIMAMVKAFSYGGGTYEFAKFLGNKVDYLAVAYTDEGIILRQNGVKTPIMVMNPDVESFGLLNKFQLEPNIFSFEILEKFINLNFSSNLKIHIEIDTGMHRLGFVESEIDKLCHVLKNNPSIKIASIFSHFSGSDESQFDNFSQKQISLFEKIYIKIEKETKKTFLKHINNSAATLKFRKTKTDMVRLGIGLYGISPLEDFKNKLQNVFSLKTVISQIKTIPAGDSIGYSRKAIENKTRKIAILPLGYADGFNRLWSNGNGKVFLNNQNVPIVGNICMDMCMIDVSNMNCKVGDVVEIFGEHISIYEIAKKINTIPYEILTSISQRVKRVYISDN